MPAEPNSTVSVDLKLFVTKDTKDAYNVRVASEEGNDSMGTLRITRTPGGAWGYNPTTGVGGSQQLPGPIMSAVVEEALKIVQTESEKKVDPKDEKATVRELQPTNSEAIKKARSESRDNA